jgi:DNA-binding LytR/AlgR family response regulator
MKAIIIEDEVLIAKNLQKKIEKLEKGVEIISILPSLKTARKWFMQNAEPDLIFMDIQLSDGVSFELFDDFNIASPIIFTTAYDEYAIRAFKVNGVDYLLKPIDMVELKAAIEKSQAIFGQKNKVPSNMQELIGMLQTPSQTESLYKEKFLVNVRGSWVPVLTKDIAFFVRDTLNYLITFDGQKYIVENYTLEDLEELMNPRLFYRANRQSIINIEAIQSIKPHDTQKLTLVLKPTKTEQDISREKAPAFKKWFDR